MARKGAFRTEDRRVIGGQFAYPILRTLGSLTGSASPAIANPIGWLLLAYIPSPLAHVQC